MLILPFRISCRDNIVGFSNRLNLLRSFSNGQNTESYV